jgi:hypothetical protein
MAYTFKNLIYFLLWKKLKNIFNNSTWVQIYIYFYLKLRVRNIRGLGGLLHDSYLCIGIVFIFIVDYLSKNVLIV